MTDIGLNKLPPANNHIGTERASAAFTTPNPIAAECSKGDCKLEGRPAGECRKVKEVTVGSQHKAGGVQWQAGQSAVEHQQQIVACAGYLDKIWILNWRNKGKVGRKCRWSTTGKSKIWS